MKDERSRSDPSLSGAHPATWRVFCAVEIPEKPSQLALSRVEKLRADFPRVSASWTRQEKLHLTLKFLGNIPQQKVADVSHAASSATSRVGPFEISIGEAGAFPKHGLPRVIWIGVDDFSGTLANLQARLEKECEAVGFPREERSFHPHLTLARLRDPRGAKELSAAHQNMGFDPVLVKVDELVVFRSELSPKGSRYSIISRHALNKG